MADNPKQHAPLGANALRNSDKTLKVVSNTIGDYFKAAQDIEGVGWRHIGQVRMCGIHYIPMKATQRNGVKGFDTYYECALCP